MNAVIYCRVSSTEQFDGTRLESQELACKEYAARNDLTVVRTFIERGESSKFADRPQLLELLARCAKREKSIQQVLVWKVDRLARNVGDHFNIKTLPFPPSSPHHRRPTGQSPPVPTLCTLPDYVE